MPDPAVVELERRIAAAIDAHRPELERLVDVELDRALDRLVVERLAARNGADVADVLGPMGPGNERQARELMSPTGDIPANEAQAPESCSSCGERPAAAGRRVCHRCRGRRRRERRALAGVDDADGPRSAGNRPER